MCLVPNRLKDGTLVACRYCSLCASNRLNDLVGRCIAEQSVSSSTLAVTLTYAGDSPESAVLHYRDVQLMLKRLRKDGYKIRYICAGEYGTRKGRAHWHIILFFRGKSPAVQIDHRVSWDYWPHGFSYFQRPDYGGFRYVMKYALKDQKSEAATRALSMSKKPPLGHDFFIRLAHDLVERGLPVHSPEYAFAGVLDRKGKARRYWLQGRMREMWLKAYCARWNEVHGGEPPQTDFLLEKYLDPIARREMAADTSMLIRDIERKRPKHVPDYSASDEWEKVRYQRAAIGFYFFDPRKPDNIVIAYDDYTADLCLGGEEWTIGNETAERQLQSAGLTNLKAKPVSEWLESKWSSLSATSLPRQ